MAHFYVHLTSKENKTGMPVARSLTALAEAYEHARALLIRYCFMLATTIPTYGLNGSFAAKLSING
jgi:hypothetical protein